MRPNYNHFHPFLPVQGVQLVHNQSAGILLSNQSLVLQRVSRSSAGLYVCTATNARGEGGSQPLRLSVKCK